MGIHRPQPTYAAEANALADRMLRGLQFESIHGPMQATTVPAMAKAIMLQVAERRGVRVVDMVGPLRCKQFVDARYEAIYEIRLTGRYSLPQIGRFFNRDHSSIHYAINEWPKRADTLGIPCVPLNGEGTA